MVDFYTFHAGLTGKRRGRKAWSVNNSSSWPNGAGQEVNKTTFPTQNSVWDQVFGRKYSERRQAAVPSCVHGRSIGGALPVLTESSSCCNLAEQWFHCSLLAARARHIVTADSHTNAKQGICRFPKENHFASAQMKIKQAIGWTSHLYWKTESELLVWTVPTISNVLPCIFSSGLEPCAIAATDGSTYDSWQRLLCERMDQAASKPCPFPTELHSLTAAKTLFAYRELSFTDACEFSIASILRNWLYPGQGEQGKNMPGDLPKVTSLICWRAWKGGEIDLLAPTPLINNQTDMSPLTLWSKSKLIKPTLGVNIIKSVETWLISN